MSLRDCNRGSKGSWAAWAWPLRSLLGLAGSLVVGLLELFAGHGQNRFYRELEEWLSTITRVSFSSGEDGGSGDQMAVSGILDHMAEQMEAMQLMFTQSDVSRSMTDEKLAQLTVAMERVADRLDTGSNADALARVADSQERMIAALSTSGAGGDGIDAESRMRLRSIDVQLLRILEEITAGRQEAVSDLRGDLQTLGRALKQGNAGGGGGGGNRRRNQAQKQEPEG